MNDVQEHYVRSSLDRARRNRERTAYHEGGHVAAAWSLRAALHGPVTISPDIDCWGSAAVGKWITNRAFVEVLSSASLGMEIAYRARSAFEAQIQVLFAGRLAEARAVESGEARGDPIPTGSRERKLLEDDLRIEAIYVRAAVREAGRSPTLGDDERAWQLLTTLSAGREDEANAYGRWLWERTRRRVDSEPFWTITRAVARALLGVETLGPAAVRRIVRAAIQPQQPPLEFSNYASEP